MLYTIAIAVHVVVAVLAIGLVGAVPLTARFGTSAAAEKLLPGLLRTVQLGLGLMLITGLLLDWSAVGGFHRMTWFQVSMAVLVVLGISLGRARAALRARELRRVEQWGWAMCAAVAVVTLLMQVK